MTDEIRRAVERQASIDVLAELRVWIEARRRGVLSEAASGLLESLARGELQREQIALAAYAGHAGALALLEGETSTYAAFTGDDLRAVRVVFDDQNLVYDDLRAWLLGLERWGTRPLLFTRLAMARGLVDRVRSVEVGSPADEWGDMVDPREHILATAPPALDAAERFLVSRSPADCEATFRGANELGGHYEGVWFRVVPAIVHALRCAEKEELLAPTDSSGGVMPDLIEVCSEEQIPPRELAAAVKRSVVGYALTKRIPFR